MESTDLYLEPVKYYKSQLKQAHKENVENFFEELTNKSGVSKEENKATIDLIKKTEAEKANIDKKISKTKFWRGVLIFFGILLCVAIIGIFLLIWAKKIRKEKVEKLQEQSDKLQKKIDENVAIAQAQMAPLNALFDDKIPLRLMSKTTPLIKFDETFAEKSMQRLINQFDEEADDGDNVSTLVVQSGSYNENPFVLRQNYKQWWGSFMYTGTLVITWTTIVHDDHGSHPVTHTQTLVAHVTKPIPEYGVETVLKLYSEVAPKLSFSRSPTKLCDMNEKQVEKYIANKEKEEQKKAEKAIKKGGSYTKLANIKFESYFNSANRTDEVGYRVLFTPLAQTNICYQFSQKEPFKDDVTYIKDKKINSIYTEHDHDFDYSGGTYNYIDYDYEQIKLKFENYNNEFFTNLFFDFATIMSIPVFHQEQSAPYVDNSSPKRNISNYETEVIINKSDYSTFKHHESDTDVILKAELLRKGSDYDEVLVHAYSFKKIPQVEMVPTMGGDGKMHLVPVPYFIYEPIEAVTPLQISCKTREQVAKDEKSVINYRGISLLLTGLVAKEIDKDAK